MVGVSSLQLVSELGKGMQPSIHGGAHRKNAGRISDMGESTHGSTCRKNAGRVLEIGEGIHGNTCRKKDVKYCRVWQGRGRSCTQEKWHDMKKRYFT